jgi:carbon monoxide dehydrogenase subunit G
VRLCHEVRIDRAPANVFAYLSEPRNLPAWQRSVSRVTPPAEITVGARFTEERSQLGRTFRSTLEVDELEPDRLFTIKVVEGPVPATVRHELEPDGPGTRLRVEATAELDRLPRLVRSIVSRFVKSELGSDFARLKAILESRGA